jgi:hypothetical protein
VHTLEAKSTNGIMPEIWAQAKELPLQASIARVVIGAGYKVECEIVEVTPELAKQFLAKMAKNRRLKARHVQTLAREMKRGAWRFNGEPLIFDENGSMIDGQHRCQACVQGGFSFPALIIRGVPSPAFDTLDGGSKRTAADVLGILGEKHAAVVAAGLILLLKHRDGSNWFDSSGGRSSSEIAASLPLFPGLDQMAVVAAEANRLLGGKGSFWLAARYLTAQKDAEMSRAFFGRLVTGIGLAANDPEHLLRKKLLDLKGRKFSLTYPELAALVTNAWNARRRGRSLSVLRGLQGDAPVPEFI